MLFLELKRGRNEIDKRCGETIETIIIEYILNYDASLKSSVCNDIGELCKNAVNSIPIIHDYENGKKSNLNTKSPKHYFYISPIHFLFCKFNYRS